MADGCDEAISVAVDGGLKAGAVLRPWQRRNARRFLQECARGNGLLIADRMGFGKTISAIVCACLARARSGRRPVVFAVPAAVEANWEREMRKFTTWERIVLWRNATPDQRRALFAGEAAADAIILSHHALAYLFNRNFKRIEVDKFQRRADDFFERWDSAPDVHPLFCAEVAALVIDESHILRNPDAGFFNAGMFAGRHAAGWLCLSGTPHQNHIGDCVTQLRVCHAREQYLKDGAFECCPASFMSALHASSMIRAPEEPPLPPLVKRPNTIDMPAEEAAVLDQLLKRVVEVLEEFVVSAVGYDRVLVEFLRIRKASVCPALLAEEDEAADLQQVQEEERAVPAMSKTVVKARRILDMSEAPSEKMRECVRRLAVYHREGRKVVVFCTFVEPLFAMCAMEREGSADVYHGQLTKKERDAMLHRFNTDDDLKTLFVSLRAGGTGLNLQVASVAIHIDRWWNPAVTEQATHRIWREGQSRDCVVESIEYRSSFDDVCAHLYHGFKQRNSDNFLCGAHKADAFVTFDSAVAASLIEEIAVRRGLGEVASRARTVGRHLAPERAMRMEGASRADQDKMKRIRQEAAQLTIKKPPIVKPRTPRQQFLASRAQKIAAVEAVKAAGPKTIIAELWM